MAVIVEDGTSKVDSNSYVSDQELTDYATARGIILVGNTTALLIRAADYLDTFSFVGMKTKGTQALQWPRMPGYLLYSSYYGTSRSVGRWIFVDGYIVQSNEIPTRLKKAQLEVAVQMDAGFDATKTVEQQVIREKIGPIETEYQPGSSSVPYYSVARSLLAPLLVVGTGNVSVGRA